MARFKKGDHKVKCDLTGAIVNASDCRMQWNGLFVHKRFHRPKPPLDAPIIQPIPRQPAVSRPEGDMLFMDATDVTPEDL